jgi:hypothetical protein
VPLRHGRSVLGSPGHQMDRMRGSRGAHVRGAAARGEGKGLAARGTPGASGSGGHGGGGHDGTPSGVGAVAHQAHEDLMTEMGSEGEQMKRSSTTGASMEWPHGLSKTIKGDGGAVQVAFS